MVLEQISRCRMVVGHEDKRAVPEGTSREAVMSPDYTAVVDALPSL